jgi:membrane-associated phospholipid phosphatase
MTAGLRSLLIAVTDAGDSTLLAGIVAASAGYLLFSGCRKGAAAMILSFVTAAIIVGGFKLAFLSCGTYYRRFGIQSPSGHTALSLAVFSAFAMLLASRLAGWRRFLVVLLLSLLIAAIGVTRVLLGFHTMREVIIGLIAGALAAGLVRSFLRHGEIPPFDIRVLALSAVPAAILFHGTHLPTEGVIRWLAWHVKVYAHCA